MKRIPDFTDTDRWVVETALKERYEKDRAGVTSGKTGADLNQ